MIPLICKPQVRHTVFPLLSPISSLLPRLCRSSSCLPYLSFSHTQYICLCTLTHTHTHVCSHILSLKHAHLLSAREGRNYCLPPMLMLSTHPNPYPICQVERIQVAAKPTFHVPRGRIKKRRSAAVDGLTEEELREYQERYVNVEVNVLRLAQFTWAVWYLCTMHDCGLSLSS